MCEASEMKPSQVASVRVPDLGSVQGLQYASDGVRVFAGISYAKPPVDGLRWRPPRPLPKSDGSINATTFGPACPQVDGSGHVIGQEDCLTLNIFAPHRTGDSSPLLPVLVWFHGGSYVSGTANVHLRHTWGPLYNGRSLAAQGSVVVTVQYRLGAFGFLGSSELSKRDSSGSSGNYGMQDQRLALRWVQQHIAAFGGDRGRVLIFGQSAGAGSVNWHLVAKASRGLFHAAVMQSGACAPWASQTWKQTEASFKATLNAVNCRSVECLLRMDSNKLADATQDFSWSPTVDGIEMDDLPCNKMLQGELAKVPIVVGFNRDESTPDGKRKMTEADFDNVLDQLVPRHAQEEVKAGYRAQYSEWFWAAQHLKADIDVACPSRRFVHAAVTAGAPVFAYKFSRPAADLRIVQAMYGSGIPPEQQWGAYHGAELPFVFGNRKIDAWGIGLPQADQHLASVLSKLWVDFASTGRPISSWPAVNRERRALSEWLLLDSPNVSIHETQLLSQCDALEAFARQKLQAGGLPAVLV